MNCPKRHYTFRERSFDVMRVFKEGVVCVFSLLGYRFQPLETAHWSLFYLLKCFRRIVPSWPCNLQENSNREEDIPLQKSGASPLGMSQMLHETFHKGYSIWRKAALKCRDNITAIWNNIAKRLQRCVALNFVFAIRPVSSTPPSANKTTATKMAKIKRLI